MKPAPALRGLTVARLAEGLLSGELTSASITEAYLQSISLNNGAINAYIEVFAQDAMREAAQADSRRTAGCPRSALDGVPIAIKDNIVMQGSVCSCASRMLADYVSPYDATAIARLRAAGMPILGRLNMDEFAMGGSTETGIFGAARNPRDLSRVCGGSSGGAAAAVAAGMAPIALGSDTGGSVRQPASFCGVTGVKPAYGAISRYGLVAFASSLDQVGVLAADARDAAMLMDVICGADERDMTSDPTLPMGYLSAVDARDGDPLPLSGFRLGIPKQCASVELHPDVRACLASAAENWRRLGAEISEVDLPALRFALPAYYIISSAEASSNLARYDGVRYGHRAEACAGLDELYSKSRDSGFGSEVKRRIALGAFALSSGYMERYYLKAQSARKRVARELNEALGAYDALLTPTAPTPAYRLGERAGDPVRMYSGDVFTVPASLAGLPAISLSCGESAEGLPIGMHLTCARDDLPALLAAAHAYQRAQKGGERL